MLPYYLALISKVILYIRCTGSPCRRTKLQEITFSTPEHSLQGGGAVLEGNPDGRNKAWPAAYPVECVWFSAEVITLRQDLDLLTL